MPPVLAALALAVLLAGAVTAATPPLLRWLPVPPDEVAVAPFAELDSPGFRWTVFGCAAVAGCLAFTMLPVAHWAAWAGLVALGSLLGLIDLRTGFLPLRLSHLATLLCAAGVAVTAWVGQDWRVAAIAAAAGALAGGFFWLVWRLTAGFGFGDVRLAALVGLVAGSAGAQFAAWSILLGSLVGAVWGLANRLGRRAGGAFPYGPALLLGPLLALPLSRLLPPG